MSNSKISALTSATTPLAGTEVLPIVQSGTTKQVSVENLTVGRRVTALYGSFTGNSPPSSGSSLELAFAGGSGYVTAYDRTGAAFLPLYLRGSVITFAPGGTAQVNITTTGISVLTYNLDFATAAKGVNFTANTPAAGMTSQLLNWYEEGSWTPTDASGAGLSFTVNFAKYVRVGKQVTVNMFITFPATASVAQVVLGGLPFSIASSNYPAVTFASNSGVALSGYANATTTTISIGTAADYSVIVTNATMSGRNLLMSLTYLVN